MNWQLISEILQPIWDNKQNIVHKFVDTENYPNALKEIPDSRIQVMDVFVLSELQEFCLEPYFTELKIVPFIQTMGDPVFCVGYGKENKNHVYYVDFDFGGCICLEQETLIDFTKKLKDTEV